MLLTTFLLTMACVQGGLIGGHWINYTVGLTTNMSNGGPLTSMISDINCNLPWFFPFTIVLIYLAFYIIFNQVPGRKKFIAITLIPMIITWLMIGVSWVPMGFGDISTGVFILTVIIVTLTGG